MYEVYIKITAVFYFLFKYLYWYSCSVWYAHAHNMMYIYCCTSR